MGNGGNISAFKVIFQNYRCTIFERNLCAIGSTILLSLMKEILDSSGSDDDDDNDGVMAVDVD